MTDTTVKAGDHVVLVDGSAYIFRAFHALPPLTRASDKLPVGAVAGYCNMLWKLVRGQGFDPKPTHLGIILDKSETTFRKEIYPEYKAHRPELPDDLRPQLSLIREATRAFDLPCIEQDGYEADDIIATYAEQAAAAGAKVTIISSDKDLMQLVTPLVSMFDPIKDKVIGPDEVFEKFGVTPDKVVEVQALAGDATDNVPGVPGIGVKTAAQLITDYGTLEALLERAAEIKQPKRRESLITYAVQAAISKQLVELKRDMDVEVPLADLCCIEPDLKKLISFLKAMEFNTLTRRVGEAAEIDISAIEADPRLKAGGSAAPMPAAVEVSGEVAAGAERPGLTSDAATPAALAAKRAEEARSSPCSHDAYVTVRDMETLQGWADHARQEGVVAFDTETTSLDAMSAELVGISLAVGPGEACYIPLNHRGSADIFGGGRAEGQLNIAEVLEVLKPVFEDAGILKVGQNVKYDWLILKRHGVDVRPFDDTMLMSYALDAGVTAHGMDTLADRHLGHGCISYDSVTGTGKARINFAEVPIDKAAVYAAEDADVTLRLWRVLKPRLAAEGATTVYETLERPMPDVLARMEQHGISIDRQMLSRLSGEFAQRMGALEAEVYDLAGERFTIGSPKQLGDILFGKMGLPGGTKTKTGAWATGARLLDDLAEQGHELPRRILDWRQLSKLKSTYADALPTYLNAETRRVHTCFQLAATTTGRLSSSEPNIQNIPVRTEEGRKIRRAFVAEPGHKLVSADYSQIELRVLAHIADIPQLKTAFADGLDIHAMTASEMFNVPIDGMDPMVRRRAKAINFGIVYGISAFGLANQLAIPREEAGAYIKKYFERFPGIRDYMEATKAACRRDGYVTTLFGRRCHYPQINTRNPAERAFNERAAINAPIQGTAADILRRAMIRMEGVLAEEKLSARMLLQVHDELVFEVPDAEVDATLPIVKRVMEMAPLPAVTLSVPLQVDARGADNWEEAH
ncbi:DNA polymerase I [Agaricicola taiwanensis]|uniref:DNA polymerase I n=1 Tax=Agaricicola taiwanensis TaxID=591372 RepID=A0A8J2VJQ3_9RHOB|nr:DNA polymerase I [Agaricicola taiwanensis]GGE32504.1 DNA polymerase I [Agaricicola taiwanensis]